MNCAYHSDRVVEGVCSTCGRPICADCVVDLNGTVHCKTCLESRMKRPPRVVNNFARFVLSVAPGMGHLYMGLAHRGLQLLGGTVLGMALLVTLTPRSPLPFFFMVACIFFSIFDAREAHLRMEQGLDVEDKGFVDMKQVKVEWNHKYVGYGLIGLGALVLYNTLLHDTLRLLITDWTMYNRLVGTIRGMTLGGLALGAGLWMLKGGFSKSNQG